VVDQLLPALDKVNGFDFTDLGQSIGEFFGAALSFFTDDTAWELFVLNAELALAKILQLPGFKQVAEIGERLANGGNLNPVASVSDGGNVTLIEEEIQRVYDRIAEKASADAVKIDAERRKDISEEMDAIKSTAAPAAKIDMPEMQGRQFDEYQRRGLSLSKNPGLVQDKLLEVQEQIRDILKGAKIQGKELVWQ